MTLLAALLGFCIPTVIGWLLIGLISKSQPVFFRSERIALGFTLGSALVSYLVFLLHWAHVIGINLVGFLSVQICLLLILGVLYHRRQVTVQDRVGESVTLSPWQKRIVVIVGLWIVVKFLFITTTAFMTPTYFDDALDNWNLRAKIFHHHEAIVLEIPGDSGPIRDNINSYPPTVPLVKVWFMTLNGQWSEPLAKLPHVVWFLALTTLLLGALRRITTLPWALVGTAAFVSLPLVQIHTVAQYADTYMALHTCIPIAAAYFVVQDKKHAESWIWLLSLSTGILLFTKNESLVLQLPAILAIIALLFWKGFVTTKHLARIAVPLLVIGLPWIAFKSLNSLNFGNAKGIADAATFVFEPKALYALLITTFVEGNWNIFPALTVVLFAMYWKQITQTPLKIIAIGALLILLGQTAVFTFTSLATEAIMQTGSARGHLQVVPLLVILVTVLFQHIWDER